MAFGGSDDVQADMQASALAYNLGKVSLSGPQGTVGRAGRDGPVIKYQLRDLEIQQTIGELSMRETNTRRCQYVKVFAHHVSKGFVAVFGPVKLTKLIVFNGKRLRAAWTRTASQVSIYVHLYSCRVYVIPAALHTRARTWFVVGVAQCGVTRTKNEFREFIMYNFLLLTVSCPGLQ